MTETKSKKKRLTVPKTLGACVDLYYKLREERHAMQRDVDAIKEQETEIANHVINELPKSQAEGIVGKSAKGVINRTVAPTIEDFEQFTKYVREQGGAADDLLMRRVNTEAAKARWEAGETIPGVGKFNVIKLSVTRVK